MIKANTARSYQERMSRVTNHLFDNLDKDIRIEDLAEVAHLSPYHWHRIYKAMQGETVASTIRRLRLERSANELANSDAPIREIADRARFSSVEAFTRAFKSAYDQTPAAFREAGSHNAFKLARAANDAGRFDVTIGPLPEYQLASVPHRGSFMQINHAMAVLFGELAKLGQIDEHTAMLGVFYDDPDLVAEEQLRSCACASVPAGTPINEPLQPLSLYAGDYAQLTYQGPYADMKDAYAWFYGIWLPSSGYEPADAPTVEHYLNNPQNVPPTDLLTRMCLPLRSH